VDGGIKDSAQLDLITRFSLESVSGPARSRSFSYFNGGPLSAVPAAPQSSRSPEFRFFMKRHRGSGSLA